MTDINVVIARLAGIWIVLFANLKPQTCFLACRPIAAWNSLPEHIRADPDIHVFRKLLKTHLFNLSFNVLLTTFTAINVH